MCLIQVFRFSHKFFFSYLGWHFCLLFWTKVSNEIMMGKPQNPKTYTKMQCVKGLTCWKSKNYLNILSLVQRKMLNIKKRNNSQLFIDFDSINIQILIGSNLNEIAHLKEYKNLFCEWPANSNQDRKGDRHLWL